MRFSVVFVLGAFAVCPGCVGAGAAEDAVGDGAASASDPSAAGAPLGVVPGAALRGAERVGSGAAACWWWGPPPHGVVAEEADLAVDAVAR